MIGKGKLQEILGLDLRSLGLFRVCLALVVLVDLFTRFDSLVAHYTDEGVLPLEALKQISPSPFYWSFLNLSGSPALQTIIFVLAIAIALLFLVGYRTRFATIALWAMIVSIHNRNPVILFAADEVLRAILFWCMFLPLGATYSIDSALNTNPDPLPKRILSGATFALMVQICYIYMWSAAFKTKSETWWPDGTAVYYALSFDQYVTVFGGWLLMLPLAVQKVFTLGALFFEWVGPLIIFIPFRNSLFKCIAIVAFIGLHIGFGLSFHLGIFPFLSITHWLPLIPSNVWDFSREKIRTPEREGLRINYDKDCGFCKKVVYLLRTFLILPGTPLLIAQDNPSIYADMLEKNSWVVEDWRGDRYYKWEGIAYICSLSPLFWWLSPILRLPPLMKLGTKLYETIASNRRFAGNFTKPFKFRPLVVRSFLPLNLLSLFFLVLATIWNLKNFVTQSVIRNDLNTPLIASLDRFLSRRTFQVFDPVAKVTRLDQYWSIFAPSPPKDDGWFVAVSRLADGSEVDLFKEGKPVSWDKPTESDRNRFYKNMQWRSYYIDLTRTRGKVVNSYLAHYLCHQWNNTHPRSQQVQKIEVYFLNERTVPPGENQPVIKQLVFQHNCTS
ncbi:MAG: hypothetical protein N5P05_003083 [Chroococcopsis gigantea SAG 12.99]|jgi:hypothetical protein|nr:HTTM domain-containing protein [Chlorogloea purpurea SAG 13.99]MDV3001477.1 hypothetical protein [Chroococcopsis gigantea SAG 12.99]